jgi:hypothetical protein
MMSRMFLRNHGFRSRGTAGREFRQTLWGPLTIVLLFSSALLYSCSSGNGGQEGRSTPAPAASAAPDGGETAADGMELTYRIIPAEGGLTGYGYDIYLNGKLYVHQPTVPAVTGLQAFPSQELAAATAGLVISKIRQHILPPTVDLRELDSLGVDVTPAGH